MRDRVPGGDPVVTGVPGILFQVGGRTGEEVDHRRFLRTHGGHAPPDGHAPSRGTARYAPTHHHHPSVMSQPQNQCDALPFPGVPATPGTTRD